MPNKEHLHGMCANWDSASLVHIWNPIIWDNSQSWIMNKEVKLKAIIVNFVWLHCL